MRHEHGPVPGDRQVVRPGASLAADRPVDRRRRVPDASRSFRLRQDHLAEHLRRLRARDGRSAARGRARHHPAAGIPAQHGHGVPELRAVPAHERGAERRLWAAGARAAARRGGAACRRGVAACAVGRVRQPRRAAALGRAAAACGAGAGDGDRASDPADGRAARRAGPAVAPRSAAGDPPAARGGAADHALRHARPRGSAGDVRPDCGHARRPGRADRHRAGALPAACQQLCRALPRRIRTCWPARWSARAAGPGCRFQACWRRSRAMWRLVWPRVLRPSR